MSIIESSIIIDQKIIPIEYVGTLVFAHIAGYDLESNDLRELADAMDERKANINSSIEQLGNAEVIS